MSGPVAWVEAHAARTPDAPCVGVPGAWLSYGEVQARVGALRAALAALGVGPGVRVLLALSNAPATVCCWLAVHSLGATTVEVDRAWSPQALAEAVAMTRPALAVVEGRDARRWGAVPGVTRCLVVHPQPPSEALRAALEGRFAGWLDEAGRLPVPPAASRAAEPEREEDLAQIVFTSGSTGAPRGVLQLRRNLRANTEGIVGYLGLEARDRALLVLPLFYVFGKSVLLSHLRVGASVFMDHRFMYPRVVMEALGQERCTNFSGVPQTYELLRRQVDFSTVDRSSLRFVAQAGGAMAPETIAWARRTFAPARTFVMYGQAEATARLSYLPPERAEDKAGSVGRGIPGIELRVVDDAGAPVAPGVMGHLVARGDSVMAGYLDDPEATARALRDGWLWTGDLATADAEGFVTIVGRSRQMLKLGGHRVAPAELERACRGHPGVREVAVVGARDAVSGEVAVAFVVRGDEALDEAALLRHCRQALPAPRVPRHVAFLDALPRNTFGKVLLAELRQRAEALHQAPGGPP